MRANRIMALGLVALAALPLTTKAHAFSPFAQPQSNVVVAEGVVPLEDVLAGLRARYAGRHISVSGPSAGLDGRQRYNIKWLTPDGHVLFIAVDAQTGQTLSVDGAR